MWQWLIFMVMLAVAAATAVGFGVFYLCRRRNILPAERWQYAVMVVSGVVVLDFTLVQQMYFRLYLGGTAGNGKVEAGRYYLGGGAGGYVEISAPVYWFSYWHDHITWLASGLLLLVIAVGTRHRQKYGAATKRQGKGKVDIVRGKAGEV